MPVYEYVCPEHGPFDVFKPISEYEPNETCAMCGKSAYRVYSFYLGKGTHDTRSIVAADIAVKRDGRTWSPTLGYLPNNMNESEYDGLLERKGLERAGDRPYDDRTDDQRMDDAMTAFEPKIKDAFDKIQKRLSESSVDYSKPPEGASA